MSTRRRVQAMQTTTDTGATSATAGTSTASTTASTGSYSIRIFGGTWTLTWDKWIWAIAFIVVGMPMCFLTVSMWKMFRLIYGGLIGFFVANALEMYCIMPYVYPNGETYSAGWKIVWYVAYAVFALLGVFLFWKCPNLSIGVTSAWLLYMAGLQFNGWLYLSAGDSITQLVYLLIAIAWAVGGFFLGCYFPNFTIMAGTAAAGAFLAVCGVGIMAEQYPGVSSGERTSTWWMYFMVQICISVGGFMMQCCWGYKKNNHRVLDSDERLANMDAQVEANVQIRV